jgi:hypothetical protein
MTLRGVSLIRAASRCALILCLLFGCVGKSGAEAPQAQAQADKKAMASKAAEAARIAEEAKKRVLRVLFIGNSLTNANNLPLMVQAMAKANGKRLLAAEVTSGGANLEDHWNSGEALRVLRSKSWHVVVLQQGPSSLPESRVHLREWTRRWADEIYKSNGSRPALFMVWPGLERDAFFDDVRESYSLAARDVFGLFMPAGEALREARRRNPRAPIYDSDAFHPSVAGTYAAALSIYGVLYKKDPNNLPARLVLADGQVVEIPQALARLLQDSATAANRIWARP